MKRAVVWFKRDLRVLDHAPLMHARDFSEVWYLYVFEEEVMSSPEYDGSHHAFICESLRDLDDQLRKRGGALSVRQGRIPEVLAELNRDHPFTHLFSHEETGNHVTYARDLRVADWCRESAVQWLECPQFGIVRPLRDRDGWAQKWKHFMDQPILTSPERLPASPEAYQNLHLISGPGMQIPSATRRNGACTPDLGKLSS